MEPKQHLLIIDDDVEILSLVSTYFTNNGYQVSCLPDGKKANALLKDLMIDLIILDIMLPGINGLDLCKDIRNNYSIPIIMLSAAHSEADRVAGLELGADDYMVKPFGSRELLARVKALLRRTSGELSTDKKRLAPLKNIYFLDWQLDRETHSLIGADKIKTSLSQREYDLLLVFLEHPKRILSRNQLMDLLYNRESEPFDRTIDVLIGRLRKKIEVNAKSPELLITVRGGGYMLTIDSDKIT